MIRIATENDYETVKELSKELAEASVYGKVFSGYLPSEEDFKNYTTSLKDKICILSYSDDELAGFAAFDILPWLYLDIPLRMARLSYIYVRPEFRGKGLGKEINEAFEHWGKQVGARWFSKGNSGKNEGYTKVETIYMKEIK